MIPDKMQFNQNYGSFDLGQMRVNKNILKKVSAQEEKREIYKRTKTTGSREIRHMQIWNVTVTKWIA